MRCPFCDDFIPSAVSTCPSCKAPLNHSSNPTSSAAGDQVELEEEIRQLLDQGQSIEAIKLYRERSGVSLLEAKRAVEEVASGKPMPVPQPQTELDSNHPLEQQVLKLLSEGKKLEAIKLYRETSGCGLAEAKVVVERFAAKHGLASGGGCFGVILLFIACAGTAFSVLA